jgi:hypothetical protein
MAFTNKLAEKLRSRLYGVPGIKLEEKKMFRGLAFMVNGKMCINVSGDNLMCRFDPALTEEISKRIGYEPMIMKGKELKGYCYVKPEGFAKARDFTFWINLCLDFNDRAKSSKKKNKK